MGDPVAELVEPRAISHLFDCRGDSIEQKGCSAIFWICNHELVTDAG